MELTGQIFTFLITIGTGMVLGALFDCYRVLRGTFDLKSIFTWFTDLLYWLIATVVIFIALLASNWGELRFYVFIGIISGLGLYYSWFSMYTIRLLSSILKLLVVCMGMLKRTFVTVFLKPGIYCIRLVGWPIAFLSQSIKRWYSTLYTRPPSDE